ncbi:MAG: hypothetical protein OXH22_06165 [Chloroflexi bacterium]|nr:hypothetical protein [Chloroflexota bacterium]
MAKLLGVYIAGIVSATGGDGHIQCAALLASLHNSLCNCVYMHDIASYYGRMHGRDGNPEPKKPQP